MQHSFAFFLRIGIHYGEVYTTSPSLEGLAMWTLAGDPRHSDVTLWRVIRHGGLLLPFTLGRGAILRHISASNFVLKICKRIVPFRHWHLQLLGVDPGCHGSGHASALLRPMLARIDEEHLPCYLDTQNERNVALYRHFGFEVADEGIIPNTQLRTWAMLRRAG